MKKFLNLAIIVSSLTFILTAQECPPELKTCIDGNQVSLTQECLNIRSSVLPSLFPSGLPSGADLQFVPSPTPTPTIIPTPSPTGTTASGGNDIIGTIGDITPTSIPTLVPTVAPTPTSIPTVMPSPTPTASIYAGEERINRGGEVIDSGTTVVPD